jgi:hypothetical protein
MMHVISTSYYCILLLLLLLLLFCGIFISSVPWLTVHALCIPVLPCAMCMCPCCLAAVLFVPCSCFIILCTLMFSSPLLMYSTLLLTFYVAYLPVVLWINLLLNECMTLLLDDYMAIGI